MTLYVFVANDNARWVQASKSSSHRILQLFLTPQGTDSASTISEQSYELPLHPERVYQCSVHVKSKHNRHISRSGSFETPTRTLCSHAKPFPDFSRGDSCSGLCQRTALNAHFAAIWLRDMVQVGGVYQRLENSLFHHVGRLFGM